MLCLNITRSTPIQRTPRVVQIEGLFDLPPARRSELTWQVHLPIDDRPWQIGLIVGPSGCGKTTLARKLFGEDLAGGFEWPEHEAIVDGFPVELSIKEITLLLSSVGFSSPPSWLRPFRALSNGEQFRATMARALAEQPDLVVFDEFTSVVDRTVAQIGSAAVAKTIRRRPGQQFVAVTCHYDVAEWLDPDWIYEPATDNFQWRLERRGRPPLWLDVSRVNSSAWHLFRNHHYLTAKLNPSAVCFCAFLDGRPIAFSAWLPFLGRLRGKQRARRNHRTVCLPDFQGVGIGQAVVDFCASLWTGLGYRAFSASSHPGEIAAKNRSTHWRVLRAPSRAVRGGDGNMRRLTRTRATNRLTASFEYVGPTLDPDLARRLHGSNIQGPMFEVET